MAVTDFKNVSDWWKQTTADVIIPLFENAAPTYNALEKQTEKKKINGKGYRVPMIVGRPGGHTGFTPQDADFNQPVPMQSESMYVYPVGYALPMQFTGETIRGFKQGSADAIADMGEFYAQYSEAAAKRLNRMCYGDGTGALAYAAGSLTTTGAGQTLSCTTTAAATAGQTKGAKYLEAGHFYQAFNAATGAVRGTFAVTTPGTSSCVINLLSGTVTSGDPICDVGSFNRYMRGFAHLISAANRTLQGLSSAQYTDLNSPEIDLNGALVTPSTISSLKAALMTRNNKQEARDNLLFFMTWGRYESLNKQGYGFRSYTDGESTSGIAFKYKDGDTVFILDADADDDRGYAVKARDVKMFEEMPFGPFDLDDQQLRMLLGRNSSGSDNYQRAIGNRANIGILRTRAAAYFKRGQISGLATSLNS